MNVTFFYKNADNNPGGVTKTVFVKKIKRVMETSCSVLTKINLLLLPIPEFRVYRNKARRGITMTRRLAIVAALLLIGLAASSQKKYVNLAAFTTQTAMPFGKFAGLFTDQFHPGIEAGYGINMAAREKHDWFLEFKIACFYHRFVQTGIPLYANFGYRYKFNKNLAAETSIGAGYMHSIPATAKLKLNNDGVYVNNKGVGRMQAMATFGVGLGYTFNPSAKKPLSVFTTYQQRIQMPFVRSYVPLLPYNSFMVGVKKVIK